MKLESYVDRALPFCFALLFCILLSTGGCRSRSKDKAVRSSPARAEQSRAAGPKSSSVGGWRASYRLIQVRPSLRSDPAIEKWLAPYRKKLHALMSKPLARLPRAISHKRGESPLGNLISDICLKFMGKVGSKVDLFVMNHGGIRAELGSGVVTLQHTFEVLPFENTLVVVKVSGRLMLRMLSVVAQRGGEPIAGARIWVSQTRPYLRKVQVGGKAVDPKRMYNLGTSDYLVQTGWLKPFLNLQSLRFTRYSLREAFQWGLRHRAVPLVSRLDGRVSVVKQ